MEGLEHYEKFGGHSSRMSRRLIALCRNQLICNTTLLKPLPTLRFAHCSMGFSWDCVDFSDTFDIIARGTSVSFLDLFSKDSFVLMVNLLLVLCGQAPEEVRRSQSWIPSNKRVLKMNSERVFKTGLSVLDLPSLVCLVYEKFGRHQDAEKLATLALKTAGKTIPRITLHYVLGRCYGRSGEDDREGREYFTTAVDLATRSGLPYLAKMGKKGEEQWFPGSGSSEAKQGETL